MGSRWSRKASLEDFPFDGDVLFITCSAPFRKQVVYPLHSWRRCLLNAFCCGLGTQEVVYDLKINYLRYEWNLVKSYNEVRYFLRNVRNHFIFYSLMPGEKLNELRLPKRTYCERLCLTLQGEHLIDRARGMCEVLKKVAQTPDAWKLEIVREFFEVSASSFDPALGGKAVIEGYFYKFSGSVRHKRRYCPRILPSIANSRWFTFRRNQIVWYDSSLSTEVKGVFEINHKLYMEMKPSKILSLSRLVLYNGHETRILRASNSDVVRLHDRIMEYYCKGDEPTQHPFGSTYPIRDSIDAQVYSIPKNYFTNAAIAMLSAKHEIFIASWKQTPTVLLTRPPYAPLRLDQVLAYKAMQGVKIYVLLYKEVEMSGQGNDSLPAMQYLQSLHENIRVIRHPNKFHGGSTAILWSHHEKLVVVDRTIAFVGGIDLSIGRWDDELHSLDDESGLKYPGKDYRQPAEKMHIPARKRPGEETKTFMDQYDDAIHAVTSGASKISSLFSKFFSSIYGSKKEKNANGDGLEGEGTDTAIVDYVNDLVDEDDLYDDGEETDAITAMREKFECRDLYPRSGWNDCQVCINGIAARDVASHFIQRWNHHRFSTGDSAAPILVHSAKTTDFGVCAYCKARGIFESARQCSHCNKPLGPVSKYVVSPSPTYLPIPLQSPLFSYIEFEVKIRAGKYFTETSRENEFCCFLKMHGDAPVVVIDIMQAKYVEANGTSSQTNSPFKSPSIERRNTTSTVKSQATDLTTVTAVCENATEYFHESLLTVEKGDPAYIADLKASGLYPAPGDILVEVNGDQVNHVNAKAVKRLISICKERGMPKRRKSSVANLQEAANIAMRLAIEEEQAADILNDREDEEEGGDEEEGEDTTAAIGTEVDTEEKTKSPPPPPASIATSMDISEENRSPLRKLSDSSTIGEEGEIILRFRRHHIVGAGLSPMQGQAMNVLQETMDNADFETTKRRRVARESLNPRDGDQLGFLLNSSKAFTSEVHGPQAPASATDATSSSSPNQMELYRHNIAGVINSQLGVWNGHDNNNLAMKAISTLNKMISSPLIDQSSMDARHACCLLAAATEVMLHISSLYASSDVQSWLKDSYDDISLPSYPSVDSQQEQDGVDERYDGRSNDRSATSFPPLPSCCTKVGSNNVQVLRSFGKWSGGLEVKECSIMNAWAHAIETADHYVYIENQFFIGNVHGEATNPDGPHNIIPMTIINRVIRAAVEKQPFKCIIIIPQHPQGDVVHSLRPRTILHYQQETINRGFGCMIEKFQRACPGVDIGEYLNFYCLQNYGFINDQFVHNQIYVHDKVCIVDDRVCIIGSANINDRSMWGEHDSEVAIRIEDTQIRQIMMNRLPYNVGTFNHQVRLQFMRQQLGDTEIDVNDIVTKEVYDEKFHWRAHCNSTFYSQIDKQKSIYGPAARKLNSYKDALANYTNPTREDEYVKQATSESGIKGFLIHWPLEFLIDEDISPPAAVSAMVPKKLWL